MLDSPCCVNPGREMGPSALASARLRVGEVREHVAVARARRAPAAERIAGELGQRGDPSRWGQAKPSLSGVMLSGCSPIGDPAMMACPRAGLYGCARPASTSPGP